VDLTEALRDLLPLATPWFAGVWLVIGSLRYLQAGAFFAEWTRPWLSRRWERKLRSLGASDKELRKFVSDYALRGQGRSP
jgi:hypothetical protein